MPAKATAIYPFLYSFDAGNGGCKGLSTDVKGLIEFEPVIAPMTTRRGINPTEDRPAFSLKVDDQILVFGVDDVFAHGKRTAIRRLNSTERYTNPDYFRLLDVLFLKAFAAYRGDSGYISPTGVISVPVGQYNNQDVIDEIRSALVGSRDLVDYEGCTLRLTISEKRLLIIPESYGALMHRTYDPVTLFRRDNADTAGTTLVVDIGYETTDLSLFEGLKYQRDRAESISRTGTGIIARTVQEYADQAVRGTDVSRVDRALRLIAGKAPGAEKLIEPSPGVWVDITDVYDAEVDALATRIAQEVLTRFPEAVTRVLLAGGGAYHLERALRANLEGIDVEVAPDPVTANVCGAFTMLKIETVRRH